MENGFEFSEHLVFTGLEFSTDLEALNFIAYELVKQNYVNDEFPKAVIARELKYPTGLPADGIKIAIPHTDSKYVKHTAIAIGVLKKPVQFSAMDDFSRKIDVEIIVMLAMKEPHGQIEMLQKVIALIQDQQLVKEIAQSDSKKQIVSDILSVLAK
ncbi:PTS sugar transporter subunit IIA [Sporolactobacillus terrae]|uniref:PTS sugar transporter subunit IIA n=1 Tax=Sporolactobacillus terrae TaxID=269673 RepID=UPI00159BCB94|nr:PTS sugar transporter subunit IIA [Sporolactobacillus terrae]